MTASPFRAVTIDVEGNARAVEWDITDGVLKHLQATVGGFVDVVRLGPLDMWVNDNGIVDELPVNAVATEIACEHGLNHQPYFGPAVFTGGVDEDGETLPLSPEQVTDLLRLARLCGAPQA